MMVIQTVENSLQAKVHESIWDESLYCFKFLFEIIDLNTKTVVNSIYLVSNENTSDAINDSVTRYLNDFSEYSNVFTD